MCVLGVSSVALVGAEKPLSHYPPFEVSFQKEGGVTTNYYVFRTQTNSSASQKRLLIFLEGRGRQSVLGKKTSKGWETVALTYLLVRQLRPTADVLVPERIGLEPGEAYLSTENVALDHFKNKVSAYTRIIDAYLSEHPDYAQVVLMGFSEGGILVPRIYHNLHHKNRISALILCASGGLSYFEDLKIQQHSDDPFSAGYRKRLEALDDTAKDIRRNPFRSDKTYFGWPYFKWAYFLSYQPLSDLVKVSIPILILHGDADLNIPVQSSRAIVQAFHEHEKTNYWYKEYQHADHYFNQHYEIIIRDINQWLVEKGLFF